MFRLPSIVSRWARIVITAFVAGSMVGNVQSAESKTISDFTLPDYRGKEHSLNELKDKSLIVVAFLGTECPLAKLYGPVLSKLAQEYATKNVAFIGINPNRQDSLTEIAAYARQHGIEFPLLKDLENKVADSFQAQRTPEVFILDRQLTVRYQGRVDDRWGVGYVRDEPKRSDLKVAIEELLADKEVSVPKTDAVGCLIGRVRESKPGGNVTYGSHIAALFQKRCVECHRSGDIGPFALTSYEEAVGWADMIQEVVQQERMPPWHASPKYGHFADDRRLSDEEKQLINDWVTAGAPAGDLANLPKPLDYPVGWQLQTQPDFVINMRETPFEIPATGEVRYQFFRVDPGFKEEKWITASEIVPGNRAVVHHILIFAVTGNPRESLGEGAGGGFIAGFVPGMRIVPLPQGMAKRIPAGAKLIFQVHYTPNGSPQLDNSKLGLWFADDKTVTHEVKSIANATRRFAIPPHDGSYKVEATTVGLPADVLLLSLSPHMHLRGKDFNYAAIFPDGRQEMVLDVPHYDFNWQTRYRLAEPLKLPAGTKMHSVAHFDNSEHNLSNPDPSKTVYWGDQTWEEMMIGYFDVAIERSQAEKLSVDGGGESRRIDGKQLMTMLDRNKDGKISSSEIPERFQNTFKQLDRDANGELTAEELAALSGRR
jgi:peroxiredoxin